MTQLARSEGLQAREDDADKPLHPFAIGTAVSGGVAGADHQVHDVEGVDVTSDRPGVDSSLT